MKIDVPVKNEDGTFTTVLTLDENQIQAVLQFGLNFLVATGMVSSLGIKVPNQLEQMELDFND